jgi:outer membrane receptor protein involved in Fe transport
MFRQARVCLVAAAICAMAATARAQTTPSHLIGTVKDAQGAVLPGVTVTATSPALIGGQTVVTEANGSYRFPSLPSGTYSLKFDLSGFKAFTRSGIVLALGQTLTVDATMQLATLQESVTVTAQSPIVDTSSTSVGNTLDTKKLIDVPSSSDLWGALAQSPGVRMRGFDVGGSHKSQQSGYEAFGISGQTRIVTEGVDTTEGTSGAGFYQDYFSQNEIAVSGAGQDVSMNTPGAAVISTIKSGGNRFSSLVNQTYEGKSFVANNVSPGSDVANRGGSAAPNLLFWENHDDLGGPIMRDKLWFFVAYDHFHIDKAISGVDPNVATDLGFFNTVTTKESWKPSSKDTLIGYYQWDAKHKPLRGLSALRQKDSTLAQVSPSWMYNGKWQRVWTNRLFTELNIGEFGYDFPERPSVDYKTNPPRTDLGTGVDTGAGFTQGGTTGPFELERAKPQAYGSATYFLPTKNGGSHDLKFGGEWINDMSNFASIGTSGPILYLDNQGAIDEIRLTDLGDPSKLGSTWTIPGDDNKRFALYAQDRWTMTSKITLTMGIRYDRQAPYYTEGKRDPLLTDIYPATGQPLFTQADYPQKTLLTRTSVAPRIGLAIDPTGDGKTAIKAFYGRYYFNYADSFSAVDPGGASSKTFIFNDLNGNRLYDGVQELGALVSSTGGVSTTLDPNIKVPHTDEIDASIQRQFWGESSVRVAYVRKMNRNLFATYNVLREDRFTVPVTVPVTLNDIQGNKSSQTFTVMDIPASLKGQVQNVIATMPSSVDNGAENYDTIELAFNKRFGSGFFLDSSYDWTRSNALYNNSNSTSPLTQSDPIATGDYFQNVYPTVPNRQTTTSWGFHLSSRYDFPYQIGIGLNFSVQSGWNYARRITVALPNAGTQSFWMENFSNNRSDTIPLLNFRLDKAFSLGGTYKVTGMLDVFNLTNSAAVTNFNVRNGSSYNQVIQPLDPRTLELGIRFEF